MDKDFIKELNSYCLDHFKHFSCYPLEFEYNDKIYKNVRPLDTNRR